MELSIHDDAAAEMQRHFDWYTARNPRVANQLADLFESTVIQIATVPSQYKLDGQWQAVEVIADGQPRARDDKSVRDLSFIIKGNELIVPHPDRNNNDRRKTITLNVSAAPQQIDLLHQDGAEAGKTTTAIYKVEGDRLTICMPYFGNDLSARPDEFKSKPGDGRMLIVLERLKP